MARAKRRYKPASTSVVVRRRRKKLRYSAVVPGRTRLGGYYGRYNVPSGEKKFHDAQNVGSFNTTATRGGSWNLIPQGTTEVQRIGRKCTITDINFRYSVHLPSAYNAGATDGDITRVLIVLDKQANGAYPAVSEILGGAQQIHDFRNLSNSGRFEILMDRFHVLNYSGLGANVNGVHAPKTYQNHSFHKKCAIPIEFDSTTGAIAEVRSNNIFALFVSSDGVAEYASEIRLRFKG